MGANVAPWWPPRRFRLPAARFCLPHQSPSLVTSINMQINSQTAAHKKPIIPRLNDRVAHNINEWIRLRRHGNYARQLTSTGALQVFPQVYECHPFTVLEPVPQDQSVYNGHMIMKPKSFIETPSPKEPSDQAKRASANGTRRNEKRRRLTLHHAEEVLGKGVLVPLQRPREVVGHLSAGGHINTSALMKRREAPPT